MRPDEAGSEKRGLLLLCVSPERVIEANAGNARIDAGIQMVEPRLSEDDLGVDERRGRAATVVEQLTRDAIALDRALQLALRRVDREVCLDDALVGLRDLELDAV